MVDTEYMFKELDDDRDKHMKHYKCTYIELSKEEYETL